MDARLWDLFASVKSITLGIKDSNITKSSNKFFEELKRASPIEIEAFKNQHYSTLLKLKHLLLSCKERSIHDKIFNILMMPKNSPQQITLVFEQFIKGITYFKKESAQHPIYHRLASCGDGSKTFRESYNICTNKTIKEKRKIIERCYTERLIYNELYIQQTINDDRHKNWLEQTKLDFQTCFPRIDIKVNIEEYDGIFPIKVRVEKYRDDKLVYSEVFQKELIHGVIPRYEEIVVVTRNDAYHRIQRF